MQCPTWRNAGFPGGATHCPSCGSVTPYNISPTHRSPLHTRTLCTHYSRYHTSIVLASFYARCMAQAARTLGDLPIQVVR